MLFNSIPFLILALTTFALYYAPILRKYQVYLLIASSLIFYSYQNIQLVLLLLVSAFINVFVSYNITYKALDNKHKKLAATVGVFFNLFILAFFKYSPLFSKTFFTVGSSVGDFLLQIPLPIGISFFTFQGISLLVDVYTGKHFVREDIVPKSFVEHAKNTIFYIAFFPQLIAGPIVKAHDFLPQIKPKFFSKVDWEDVFKKLLVGYFLKMVVADNLKDFTFWIEFPYFQAYSTSNLLLMLLGYSCQIFADFAGYSLIAIGLAKLFGYSLGINFNYPYIATSFKEFWKRWHISLSSFLMEYLYIPLGGNRKGRLRTYFNLFITMVLGGLWHGAAWSYAVWGAFHGLALALERFLSTRINLVENTFITVVKRLSVFVFITFAWLLFKLPNFAHVIAYFRSIFENTDISFQFTKGINIVIYSSPIFLYHLIYMLKRKGVQIPAVIHYMAYGCLLFLLLTNSGSAQAFVYFQF